MSKENSIRHSNGSVGKSSGLRRKMLLYFGLLFALTIAALKLVEFYGIPFTSFNGAYRIWQSEEFKQLDLVADLKKERLERWIEERRDDTKIVAHSAMLGIHVAQLSAMIRGNIEKGDMVDEELWAAVRNERSYQMLMQFLNLMKTTYGVYDNIQIADAATGTVVASLRDADLGLDISAEDYFIESLRPSESFINIRKCERAKRTQLFISHVIKAVEIVNSHEGRPQAVISMHINPDDFITPMLHTGKGLGETGEALLIDQDVKILTSLKYPLADGTEAKPLEYKIQARPAILAARGNEGIIMTQDYRGVPVLAAYRHIQISPGMGWGMVVKQDRAEVFGPLWQSMSYSFAVSFISIVAILVATYVIATRLSRPIRLLSQVAQQVEAGDLNARAPVARAASHEIDVLTGAFNSMMQRVQDWYVELDEQVRIRTAELREQTYILDQRVKELNCLYGISTLIQTQDSLSEDIFQEVAGLIPNAWQYPEITCARIILRDQKFETENFEETRWNIASDIIVHDDIIGSVAVYYSEEKPEEDEGTFLAEERSLLNVIAERLGSLMEHRAAEQELWKSEERFALAVRGATDGLWDWDLITGDLWLAPRFKELLGYQDDEFDSTFSNWESHIHPDDRGMVLEAIRSHQEARAPYDVEYRLKAKTHEYRWFRTRGQAIWDRDGVPYRMSGSIQDITDRRHAVEEIRRLNEELEQRVVERTAKLETANGELKDFAYVVSHDLKAPLRAISQLADWISQDYAPAFDDNGREQMELLIGRARRMDSLIDGILQYSRVGRIRGKEELIHLNELVQNAIEMLAPPDHIQVTVDDLPDIICDRTHMEQVFQNLLDNAVKFMDKPKGEVRIDCIDEGDSWRFSVRDNGPGIDQRHHEKIFQIFQALTPRDERESTGIGLTIVKKIIQLHGGEIWVESEVGAGATFHFTLPKRGEDEEQ